MIVDNMSKIDNVELEGDGRLGIAQAEGGNTHGISGTWVKV